MADLATLKVGVDSREVKTAATDLDALGSAAGRTNASVDKLTASNKRLTDAIATTSKPIIEANRMLNSMQIELSQVGKSALQIKALEIRMAAAAAPTAELSREIRTLGAELIRAERSQMLAANGNRAIGQTGQLARHHMLNLGFQFQDLGVQIASGQNPLIAFVQQGAQIGGIMGQAQIGIGGVVRAFGSMVAAATAAIVTNPILMGIAAAAATVALAFNFMANDISAASGVSVTASDVMLGAFDVVRNFLATQVTAAFAYFGTTAGEVWNTVIGYTRNAVNIIIGIVSLIPRAFVEAFKTVPTAINQLMSGDFSGALATISGGIGKIAGDTFGRDYIGQVGIALSAAAVNRANERKAQDAGKKIGRTVASGAAMGITDGRKEFVDALNNLIAENSKIGMSPEAVRKMEVENLAVRAAAKGYDDLAANIRKVGMARELNLYAVDVAQKLKEEAAAQAKVLEDQQKRLDALNQEIELMGLASAAAAERAAVLEAERLGLVAGTDAYKAFLAAAAEQAGLEKTRDNLKEIKDAMQEVKDMTFDIDLEGVFGNVGKAVGGLVNVLDDYAKRQKTLDTALKGYAKGSVERSQAELKSFRNQINLYGNLASSAKGFFKEKSTGYKLMQAAETAFRAFEFAMSLKSIAMKGAETTATVAGATAEAGANVTAGASKIFSQLGMWAFPVVAAMIAVMASLGGKGGSVSQPNIPSAEDMQATQGTGSVLGDATAKSDSINKALEIMAKNSNSDLEYSNQMLTSLRSIQNSMADLSNNVAKQISVSGSMFDTSGQRLGSSGSGGFLGIGKTSTTRELQDLGIDIVSTTIAEIIAGGISGSTYQVIEQVKKKSGFLGIGGGTKTTYQTTTGNIDQDVRDSITGVIASLRQGLIDGANVIGLDGAQAILDSFQVNIGKISLAGLSGSEIEEQLNAVFSKVGDEMAGALFPALTGMQRIGEGLFETFARVAREYQVVDVALASIGKEFGAVGVSSLAARSALVQMFESLDQFVEQTNFFRDNFLTEAERIAPVTQAVAAELERLGLASITTIDQFKNAVLGLDLTSASGQETYAALLQLAPAFKMVADYQAEIAKLQAASAEAGIDTAKINAENAKAALEIQQKRVSMEIQLLEAQGFASEALAIRRRLELAAMDESLRALQEQIYAAQDAATAARDAKAASDAAARDAAQQVNLEIQLMEAQGNAAGALAARRQLELAAMNETLGALQAQIYAAQDLQASIEAASRAAQQAADQAAGIARERTNLEIQLMEEQGDAAGALAARRALELAALDESNRAIQEQIYIQQDANNRAAELAAAREAAQQRAEAARAKAEQELEARLAAAAQLANDRRQLEIQLMELQGKTSEALAARRAIELAGMDATLRGLQQRIYAEEDAAKRADAAATLASDRRSLEIELMEALGNSTGALAATRALELAGLDASLRGLQLQIYAANDAREASLAAAEAAAAAAEEQARLAEEAFALAQNRRSLEIELLDAQGFAVEALALRRAMELEAMDASLRGIQMQIWAALAQAEANELAAQVAQDAAEAQAKAAEDAAKALQDYSDALANVSQTVIDEINRLRGISATSSSSLLKAQFATLTAQARTGNLDALGKLPELSRSIEEATLGTATSALEVARIRAWLAASLSETLALQGASDSMVNATSSGLTFDGNNTASANAEQTSGELSNMSNVLYNALYQVAKNTGKSYELMDRWDGDGLPDIREDASDYY